MYDQPIKREKREASHRDKDAVTETHPAFGVVTIGRFEGGGDYKFGSSVKSYGGISLEISRAQRTRDLSRDWIHGTEQLIRIEMTHQQFVDMITTGMNASGTPCTIVGDQQYGRIVTPQDTDKTLREKIVDDFAVAMKRHGEFFDNAQKQVNELLNKKGSATKKELKELSRSIDVARSSITSHLPFIIDSFNEDIEKVATHVKNEVLHSEIVRDMIANGSDLQRLEGVKK